MQTLASRLYTAQIATIVWAAESDGLLEVDRRNIVVGIALRKSDGGDGGGLSQEDREVFIGVMNMLRELLGQKLKSQRLDSWSCLGRVYLSAAN